MSCTFAEKNGNGLANELNHEGRRVRIANASAHRREIAVPRLTQFVRILIARLASLARTVAGAAEVTVPSNPFS